MAERAFAPKRNSGERGWLQRKAPLRVGAPDDAYEREADRVADAVTRGRAASHAGLLSRVPVTRIQRDDGKPKSEEEKYKEAAQKLGEAFLETDIGKKLREKAEQDPLVKGAKEAGESFIGTLPGKVITGAAAVGAVSALAATHKELPAQIPEIPLDRITPGLKAKITYEGPVDKPTRAMITFSYTEQIARGKKPAKTRAEMQREENARMAAELAKFRAGLRYAPGTPEAKRQQEEEEALKRAAFSRVGALPGLGKPKTFPGLAQPPSALPLQMPAPSYGFRPKSFSLLDEELKLKPLEEAGASKEREKKKEEESEPLQRKASGASRDAAPSTVNDAVNSPGQPLDQATRAEMEARFGYDFSRVRVHCGAAAERSAQAVNAHAYTVGRDIVFASGRYSPRTTEGQRLLAHELTHVVQQSVAPVHGRLQRKGPPRSRTPFNKALKLNEQVVAAYSAFLIALKALPNPSKPLQDRIDAIEQLAQHAADEKSGAEQAVAAWIAGEEIPIDLPIDTANYILGDKPSTKGLAFIERRGTNTLTLIDLVLPRITTLSKIAEALGPGTPDEMREAFHTVAAYYLDTLPHASSRTVFETVSFLDTFYQDPRLIQGYGFWTYIRKQLPDLYANILLSQPGGTYSLVMGKELKSDDPRYGPGEIREYFKKGLQGKRTGEIARTTNAIREFKKAEEDIGPLPSRLGEVRKIFDPDSNAGLIRLFVDIQVRVAMLRLWQPIMPLQDLLYSTNNAGQYLLPFKKDDRERWLNELRNLENEFADELAKGDHPGIDTKVDAWQKRLRPLIDEIPAEVRKSRIIAAIVEQLPFMFVAGATAVRMGMWVRAATQSKWLVALAEGATMTVFTAASTPLNAPNRPHGIVGWTTNLAVNVLLMRIGRVFFEAGDAAARVALSRSVIASFGARVVIPTVALSALQTGVQLIEAKIKSSGGETAFTELLTLNLVLNGIGMVMGAATAMPETGAASSAPSKTLGTAAKPTAPELAKRFNIPEDQALLLLEVADRLNDFRSAVDALKDASAKGRLAQPQFEALKKQALDLADFLEARLEPLAKVGAFGSTTPDQVKGYLVQVRVRINAMYWTSQTRVVALLPEATAGLVRVGEGQQWVYDRASPPRGLAVLRADYVKRGYAVRELPSGGWEAKDTQGNLLAQVIPVNAQAAQLLGKSLATLAKGALAQEGLTRLRSQTAIPANLLEAQLQEAAITPAGEKAVPRILQHLARFIEPTNDKAWAGLSRYLELGGDPQLLARGLAYGQPKEFGRESRSLANALLEQMGEWDASALDGFTQLYKLYPRLTGERLHSLVGDFTPVQAKGILQSISLLAPRSRGLGKVVGPLTSGAQSSQRGAMGALTSGVQLAQKYPDATLVFEAPQVEAGGAIVRVTDISVQETQTTRVAGVEKTTTVEIAAVEVKEVSSASLGKRAPQELARDIQRDSRIRAQRLAPAAGSRPFFALSARSLSSTSPPHSDATLLDIHLRPS